MGLPYVTVCCHSEVNRCGIPAFRTCILCVRTLLGRRAIALGGRMDLGWHGDWLELGPKTRWPFGANPELGRMK
jgi:hypothetical protein